mgnify:CR=1 FL=1
MKDCLKHIDAIAIGGSAGSFDIIIEFVRCLPSNLDVPVFITIHVGENSAGELANIFQEETSLKVNKGIGQLPIVKGEIYVAPPDYHLCVSMNHKIELVFDDLVSYARPSIDVMFESLADVYDSGLLAILLSGANSDGAEGLKEIKSRSGMTIVQNPETATSPRMPKSAIKINAHSLILSPEEIINYIN